MKADINELEGLSSENRRKILANSEVKYKTVIKELQETTDYIDEIISTSINNNEKNFITFSSTLLQIIHIQSKILTDIRLELNGITNENYIELQYIHLNLETIYKSISNIEKKLSELNDQ
ncbi:MAG: hypothetical protein GQ533_03885 [Methanosarcinaceae archaeon]|nr:hypothetical protein [Methanosarcinaceae archaeon]